MVIAMLVVLCGAAPAKSEGRLAVIVHPDREIELSPAELAQIYLKQPSLSALITHHTVYSNTIYQGPTLLFYLPIHSSRSVSLVNVEM